MENIAKALVGLAALGFLLGVIAGFFSGGHIMRIPAESFGRACENLALLAIALMLMGKKSPV